MRRKSTRQKLIEKLYHEHGIVIDQHKMHSFRRNGFGSFIVSWSTVGQKQNYQSFWTMSDCLKYPTILKDSNLGREINIEVDLPKVFEGVLQDD